MNFGDGKKQSLKHWGEPMGMKMLRSHCTVSVPLFQQQAQPRCSQRERNLADDVPLLESVHP